MQILKVKTEQRYIGDLGEIFAARHLKRNGYKILERNYAQTDAEIDIIAENREYIVFVEVKTRTAGKENPTEPRPASSVTPEKQKKIINCAKYYLATYPKNKKVRFDVIEVLLEEKEGRYCKRKPNSLEHLVAAFNYNTAYSRRNM